MSDIAAPEVISLGCRLNAAEGETMRRLGAAAGLSDAVIVNSCAVTNEAVRQSRQAIRRARRDNPSSRIVVTGCAAQIEPARFAAMAEVDAVIGNVEKLDAEVWRRLAATTAAEESLIAVNDIMSVRDTAAQFVESFGERARAFLQVQNGCDHRCTFCIIPFGRGNSRSVTIAEATKQARSLADNGYRELVLTGVDITSWGADLPGAPKLAELVDAILDAAPDLTRLRLSSIDGAEIDDALFERLTHDARLAPYLHVSVQSGDDLILKRMKRRHSRRDVIDLCRGLRSARPEFAFGADIIAGFPTETDEMFENSVALVDDAGLNYLHVFPFSPRDGAPAARMPQVDRGVVKARAARLRAKGEAATAAFYETLVGGVFDAIMESGGRARLGNFAVVNVVDGGVEAGDSMRVEICARDGLTLSGKPA